MTLTTKSDRPRITIACCLCGRRAAREVVPLDDEWARRYPNMRGRLACFNCAVRDNYFECLGRGGAYQAGHIAPQRDVPPECDSWWHGGPVHTLAAAVIRYPREALAQGAGEYMRWAATVRRGTAPEVRAQLAAVIAEAQ